MEENKQEINMEPDENACPTSDDECDDMHAWRLFYLENLKNRIKSITSKIEDAAGTSGNQNPTEAERHEFWSSLPDPNMVLNEISAVTIGPNTETEDQDLNEIQSRTAPENSNIETETAQAAIIQPGPSNQRDKTYRKCKSIYRKRPHPDSTEPRSSGVMVAANNTTEHASTSLLQNDVGNELSTSRSTVDEIVTGNNNNSAPENVPNVVPTLQPTNSEVSTARPPLVEPGPTASTTQKNSRQHSEETLNQSLLSLLECPVCMESMEPPMVQCRRGHLVCRRCHTRLPRCPICRVSFITMRNRAMEQVAEMLSYPCRHNCGKKVRLRRRVRHEVNCPHRNYACPIPTCSRRLPLPHDMLISHWKDIHRNLMLVGRLHSFDVNLCTRIQLDRMVQTYGELFHIQISSDQYNYGIHALVTYFGPKNKAKKYKYVIKIEAKECSRQLVFSRTTHSDLESKPSYYGNGDAFYLPSDYGMYFSKSASDKNSLENTVVPITVDILLNTDDDCNFRDSPEIS